jgi:phosphoglycolate phosphatase
MHYVLFDIDGTLTAGGSGGSLGPKALNLAFEELVGISDGFTTISMAGKTDRIISREAFALHGLDYTDELNDGLNDRYLHHLGVLLETPEGAMRVLGGAHEVLTRLLDRSDVTLGLLTGNGIEGARLKLRNAGLDGYFNRSTSDHDWVPLGGFGWDAPTRPELVPVAWQRYRDTTGYDITAEDTVIIGDTPRDIECARLNGVRAVGVTTGPFVADDLTEAGADAVLSGLQDVDAAIHALLS